MFLCLQDFNLELRYKRFGHPRILEHSGIIERVLYFGVFWQDDFKVKKDLTLNLGVRWEYQPPFREVADRLSSWNPNKIDPVSGLRGAYDFAGTCAACTGSHSFGSRTLRDWGPRVGFAWQPRKGWTMRGAYGIFYEGDLPNDYTVVIKRGDIERKLIAYINLDVNQFKVIPMP